jgi:hypothetical protein
MAGSVRKRVRDGRTTWLADYFDQHGKRHNKTFGTQKAAKEWLAQTVVDIKEGTHTPTSNITVAEAGEQWIAQGERDGLERSTLDGYRRQLRSHIVPHIGRVKLAELSPAHVQHLRDRLHKARVSTDLASRVVVSLGALLACAMEYGRVARNVVRDAARQRSTRRRRLEARHTRRLEVGVGHPDPGRDSRDPERGGGPLASINRHCDLYRAAGLRAPRTDLGRCRPQGRDVDGAAAR